MSAAQVVDWTVTIVGPVVAVVLEEAVRARLRKRSKKRKRIGSTTKRLLHNQKQRQIKTNLLVQVYQENNNTKYYILSYSYGPQGDFGNNYMNWIRNSVIPEVLNTNVAGQMGQDLLTENDVKETLNLLKQLNPQSKVTIRVSQDVPSDRVVSLYDYCVNCGFLANLSHGEVNTLNKVRLSRDEKWKSFVLQPAIFLPLFCLLLFTPLSDKIAFLFLQKQCFVSAKRPLPAGDAFVDCLEVELVQSPLATELFSITRQSCQGFVIQARDGMVAGSISGFRLVIKNGFITDAYRLTEDITALYAPLEREILQNMQQNWIYTRSKQSRGSEPMIIKINWFNRLVTVDVRNLVGSGQIRNAGDLVCAQGFSYRIIQ